MQVYDDGYKVYMVMEMMHGGELLDRILQQSYFSEKEAANIVYVLVSEHLVSSIQASIELGPEDVSLLERCPHFRGCYVQASIELGPEDVSLLERCPHFRGCYVQDSMELGPEEVSLLERCPHFSM